MPRAPLILASGSPQRRAILSQLGIEFSVRAADVHELEDGPPREVAAENAYRKASAVAAHAGLDALVLGVDTVVAIGPRLYGKPADAEHARRTLRALGGRSHAVCSGLCLIRSGAPKTAVATTTVRFRALAEALIEWYVATEEWRERAGGYAVQGRGAALVTAIDGDYLNVVGLPVATLLDLAPELLFPLPGV
ncbi:MAG: Maf family protein [Solirubrobacteraceae bacterium]